MKQRVVILILLLLWGMLIPFIATAQEKEPAEDGFFSNIILAGGWRGGRPSQNEVVEQMWGGSPKNKKIDSLDDKADSYSDGIPMILSNTIGYAIAATGTQVLIDLSDKLTLEINQSLGDAGTVTLKGFYGAEHVWKNPFLVGVDRQTTDLTRTGFEVNYDTIAGTGLQLLYGLENIDVKDDVSGDMNKDLQRNGLMHTFGIGYAISFNQRNVWTPALRYIRGNMDGESNSHNAYGLGLNHCGGMGRFMFNTSVNFMFSEYDKKHDVFNKTRKESTFDAQEMVTYMETFGWRNFSFYGLVTYSNTDADITFYDRSEIIVGLGVGYSS